MFSFANILTPTLIATFALIAPAALAVAPLGPEFDGVDVKNKLGQMVDTKIPFTDPSGETVTLANYLDGQRPVVFTLNFYRCTSICSEQLNSLVRTLVGLGWSPGKENFRIVTASFDPRDDYEVAAGKQETYRRELVRLLAEENGEELDEAQVAERAKAVDWTFLVAREKAIRELLSNVGYSVKFDEPTQQYAHSPVTYVLTPQGKIGRYLWNLQIPPNDLKFALMESGDGNLGTFGDKVLLNCFVYKDGQYAFAWAFMRIGGGLVALVLGLWLYRFWRREKKRAALPFPLMNRSESRP